MITAETRREGLEKVAPETQTRRQVIYEYLRYFPAGLTAEELTDSMYCAGLIPVRDKHWMTVGKPLFSLGSLEDAVIQIAGIKGTSDFELRKRGLIEPVGKRESETTGVNTAVWAIKEET